MEKTVCNLCKATLGVCSSGLEPIHKRGQTLEKVQRRATRGIKSLEELSYEERLFYLRLTTLKRRREGDMIQMHKIQNQIDQISWFAEPTTRESTIKNKPQLIKEIKPIMSQRENFFTKRAANQSNKLSKEKTMAKT